MATLGVIYNLGEGQDEASTDLQERLRVATWDGTNRKVFNLPVALSIMVFFALCAQCASTLAVIRRETGTWLWPAFTFMYMTALAYVGGTATDADGNTYTMQTDMRVFSGTYVSADGSVLQGTFAFI